MARKKLRQVGKSVVRFDRIYKAKKPGKRVSARTKTGGKKRYYEYRANRSDMNLKKRI